MLKDSLAEKLADPNGTAFGAVTSDPDMIELLAHMGFDWVMIDQMFTGNDWGRTEVLIRTAESAGISPVVRVQSNPWLGHDPRIAVDVTRASGIGAKYIFVSNSAKREIEECVTAARGWHRKAVHIHPFNSVEEWEERRGEMAAYTSVIPQLESEQALKDLEDILNIDGVRFLCFAMTDASRILTKGHRPDWYVKELWDMVDRAVAIGAKNGTVVAANTSYAYTTDEMLNRVAKLRQHGVRMILLQGAAFLFQIAVGPFLREARAIVESDDPGVTGALGAG